MGLVDIIIPVFNCADVLKDTVASIQCSGLRDFSILLIDDGSTDQTLAVCEELLREYENVRCIHQENAGVSAARNRGIEASDGKYLLFFDADDSVDCGAFQKAYQILVNQNPDMLIFGMCFEYYFKGTIYRTEKMCYPKEALYSRADVRQYFSELYAHNALTSSCNKFIRRALIMENHLRYPQGIFLMEDFLFSLDCVGKCENVYMLPQAIYRYRQTEDEGKVYRRIGMIDSLSEFFEPFRIRLENHLDVFNSMCFMLLRQKLWLANPEQIRRIAKDFLSAEVEPATTRDAALNEELKNGRYWRIFLDIQKTQLRHKIAVRIKAILHRNRET